MLRGLDAFIYSLYNGAKFVVAGTPPGVTLAPEGGAHQSTITASVGMELPSVTFCEPAFHTEVDWILCDGLDQLAAPTATSAYLRLSTRPLDQAPFAAAVERLGAGPAPTHRVAAATGWSKPHRTAVPASRWPPPG